ncbi:PD-(D/E)XK nuclease family protein [Hymenobacter negativus]|uniref:PD-(D/E)XK nuclease family protein n=1 Tax=Hymenobacter negativus TaxID=2795026 RepID=A0ABS0Q5D3_9BACT|nr:PD-(D/E)XK nuclease family protein [Hymenobacter negativus]MBH8557835.1 PD-(D/E)XK nuclease family protein [Hymenobacter negativus]
MKKSFFEFLALADVEKVHSQIIAWLMSKHCEALNEPMKSQIINNILGHELNDTIITSTAEINGADIVIECLKTRIVIENKIKSSQHSNQLSRYVEEFNKDSTKINYFIFMTLIPEKPQNKNWTNYSYKQFAECLNNFELSDKSNFDQMALQEYLKSIQSITSVAYEFILNPSLFPNVFNEGKLSKQAKNHKKYSNYTQKFISENQLETILQKSFYIKVLDEISTPELLYEVGDTHGTAFINAFFDEYIVLDGVCFKTGIQFQGGTFKFAITTCSDYEKSKKEWITPFVKAFKYFKETKVNGYTKLNLPDTKAWISVSKRTSSQFYEMNFTEYVEIFKHELENARDMTAKIKALI